MTKWITIIVSIAGLVLAGYVVATSGQEAPDAAPAATPTVNPFADGIAAMGTVEAATRNLAINAPVGGLVSEVLVGVNDEVEAGRELFRLDDRELRSMLPAQEAALVSAEAELAKLVAEPRPEDLPPLRAAVASAKTRVADAEDWHNSVRAAREEDAATPKELKRAWYALDFAKAELEVAEERLKRAEAGAWEPDLRIAEARVELARAEKEATRALIERLTVLAPVAGTILKRNIEPGRFASTDAATPALVLGDIRTLHIRAQVDEEDLPRLRPDASGYARLRGAADRLLPLVMVRIEPLAMPKMSLTGSVSERVDTRVVEVVFRVDAPEGVRLYPGQVVDVYIDAGGSGVRSATSPGGSVPR